MNLDEFAFLNQQLAAMLRSGIPLEGALKQLAATMQAGALRTELERLHADLARGTPLREALPRRELPELYRHLVTVGAQGHDLPGMLTMLADYYQRRHALWTRLKGIMVYPAIVLGACLALSLLLALFYERFAGAIPTLFTEAATGPQALAATLSGRLSVLFPTFALVGLALGFVLLVVVPPWRAWAEWRLPGFRESSLSQFAATMRLLLAAGTDLPRALTIVGQLETRPAVQTELRRWQDRLAAGAGRVEEFAPASRVFPPLFLWLVGESGEDLALGFARAAEIFSERAQHRIEMLLYAALPVAVLMLGGVIICQLMLMLRVLGVFTGLDLLGNE